MTKAEFIEGIKTEKVLGTIKCNIGCANVNHDVYSETDRLLKWILETIGKNYA